MNYMVNHWKEEEDVTMKDCHILDTEIGFKNTVRKIKKCNYKKLL
jgi:hypothetical protein